MACCAPFPYSRLALLNDCSTQFIIETRYWLLAAISTDLSWQKMWNLFYYPCCFIFVLFRPVWHFPISVHLKLHWKPQPHHVWTLTWTTKSCYSQVYPSDLAQILSLSCSMKFPPIFLDHVGLSPRAIIPLLLEWPSVSVIWQQKRKIPGDVI